MPNIKPFKAILPPQNKAADVVIGLENLTISSAKVIGALNPSSFVHLLVPKIENYYLRGSKQEIAFKKIAENFDDFIQNGTLVRDRTESIYIYAKTYKGKTKTGIWAVSNIEDYLSNNIKRHELTRIEREKGLVEYLQQTGLDANPVLITYAKNDDLDQIIEKEKLKPADLDFFITDEQHQIWKVCDSDIVLEIQSIFAQMPATYIADGHHRAAAACSFGQQRRVLNPKHQGTEEYNYFSSVYISADQLEILPFHRFLKLNHLFDHIEILEFLKANFEIKEIDKRDIIPKKEHLVGFYYQQKAYQVNLNSFLNKNILHDLDVSLLQELILKPLFNVEDPREDEKLYFLGGKIDIELHLQMIDSGKFDLAFFLYPTSVNDLIQIANLGGTMPPKSTWFEPKFLAGLVTHEID
ncbi:DUF1015 domain-containing protein [Pedobacter sp. SD-b]|uniref:DUF1015 domain-containing protein n=1 Tax=Pedobacter segetis TaxID=2793069 RepID=A0ABS1BIC5_9SPHI|nr:DUF1015 family protein [Pedobacter segetis]MBK0382638.1 DUF1015 domain-containing protein [Pedobacter segetis]